MPSSSLTPINAHPRLTILCAEDDALRRDELVVFLTRAGHSVESAANGFEAWDEMMTDLTKYDVLVTDHNMPVLNGLELSELLHAVKYPGRIIVHTTGVSKQVRECYQAFGVEKFVSKAQSPAKILEILDVIPAA